jgi:hypothetical protein
MTNHFISIYHVSHECYKLRIGIESVTCLKTTHTRNVGLKIFNNTEVAGLIPDEVIRFSTWPIPSSRTMSPISTQPLTEMSTKNILVGKEQLECKTDNFTAICQPTLQRIREPRCLINLWASLACYSDSLPRCRNELRLIYSLSLKKLPWLSRMVIIRMIVIITETSKLKVKNFAGHEVLTAVIMKDFIFWDITRCSPLEVNRRFGWIYRQLFHAGLMAWLILRP